jgi:glycosyltransferase involved in cell wall biosynthesis
MIEIILFYITSFFILITTIVVIFNFFTAPQFKRKISPYKKIKVSICIPARNEESNIANILNDILKQTYNELEVLVLDDNSEDNTLNIISSFRNKNKSVKVISGDPLPAGWTGKNWACHQLSQIATGQIILFVDADCRISPWAVESAIAYMDIYSLDLLSVFPAQRMVTLSEKIIVPIMDWILLTFLPLKFVYSSANSSFIAANGQFIAFKRRAYDLINGHASVANQFVEDMELARAIKNKNLKIMTLLGNNTVSCRMYETLGDAVAGFSKNFFPGFKISVFAFILLLLFLNLLYTAPFVFFIYNNLFLSVIIFIFLQRALISITNSQNPVLNIIFHIIQMIFMTLIGINSIYKAKKRNLKWKGRQL